MDQLRKYCIDNTWHAQLCARVEIKTSIEQKKMVWIPDWKEFSSALGPQIAKALIGEFWQTLSSRMASDT